MSFIRLCVVGLCLIPLLAQASPLAPQVLPVPLVPQEELVSYPRQGGQMTGVLMRPELSDGTGILLIHDQAGIGPATKELAQRLVQEGYVVLMPDLYSRVGGNPTLLVRAAKQGLAVRPPSLTEGQLASDLEASSNYLERQVRGDGIQSRVAVIGLGWGSGPALLEATQNADLAGVVLYGGPFLEPLARLNQLQAPLLGNLPTEQGLTERLALVEAVLTKGNKIFDFKIVETTQQPTLGWERTLSFLKKYLRS